MCREFRIISLKQLLASKEKVLLFILKSITTQGIKIKEALDEIFFFKLDFL